MAYGGSNDDVIDDVTSPSKVKVIIPISLRSVISKMARDRDSVLTGYHLPPQRYIKAVKKFTWRIYALSERLLVQHFTYGTSMTYVRMSSTLLDCNNIHTHTHTHNRFTAGLEYVRVHPGQQVPER